MRYLRKYSQEITAMASVLMALVAVMMFTGQWPWVANRYNSYTRQAVAWLQGQLDLGPDVPWLELAIYQDAYYVSFPPFPSYLLLPFAAVCGLDTPDGWIALASTMLGVFFAVRLYREIVGDKNLLLWVMFLFLGSGYPFIAVNGYVWFIAQNLSFTLSMMALWFAWKSMGGWSLGCWAAAVGCRPMVIFFLPVLVALLWMNRKEEKLLRWILKRWYWVIPPALLGGSYMLLNWLRFDNVLEFGHNYLPEFTRSAFGQFSVRYLKKNLRNILRLPMVDEYGALQFYNSDGNAFWLVIPVLIPMIAAWVISWIRNRGPIAIRILVPLIAVIYTLVLCLHKTLGGWQWGTRYMLDILPWCYAGFLFWLPEKAWFHKASTALAAWGIALTVIGTVATYNYWILFGVE